MAKTTWYVLTVLLMSYLCEAAKILVVFPLPGKSHTILGEGICRHLLKAGHEITFVTPFPPKKPEKNLNIIDVSDNFKLFETIGADQMDIKAIMDKKVNLNDPVALMQMLEEVITMTMKNKQVDELLSDPSQTFDLVIVEWMFVELYSGIPVVLNCPYIWVSTMEPHWMVTKLIDEALHPAYSADCISSNVPPFTFTQRVQELWSQILVTAVKDLYLISHEKKLYEEIYAPLASKRGVTLTPYEIAKYNASLIIGNSHLSMGEPYRLPQNYIPVGGYHIDQELKPLPEDLKKLMDNSKNGVIYFSMGSNLKSKDFPDDLKRDLLKMFGTLKQTVIWKFEEILPSLPSNVHILQWAPQHSILAHPNCVLFITHGGLLSTTETIHFGVPVIGIPVFGDQFVNVERAINKGFGKKVELSHTMAADLKLAINDMLSNPSYSKKVKELSLIYHDRPVSPGKELVHWVEHVMRTRGALHLRSPALHVPWYQKMYLDLAAIVLIVIYVVKKLIVRLCCSKKKVHFQKKHN